jgi:hypothetical protein
VFHIRDRFDYNFLVHSIYPKTDCIGVRVIEVNKLVDGSVQCRVDSGNEPTNVANVEVFYTKVPSTYYDVVLITFLFSCI